MEGKRMGERLSWLNSQAQKLKEIVKKINTSIKLYVEEHGIDKFRDVETEVIKELVESGCKYISLGGGVIERYIFATTFY